MTPPFLQKSRIAASNDPIPTPAIEASTEPETVEGGDFFSMPALPRVTSDISSWIPRLWNRPEGDGAPDAVDSEENFFQEGWNAAESAYDEVLTGLGLRETEPVPLLATAPVPKILPTEDKVLESFSRIEMIPEDQRQAMWERLMTRLHEEGSPCPTEGRESYEAFQDALRELGAHLPTRIRNLRGAMALLARHESLGEIPLERPIALVVLAASDHNGALSLPNGFPMLDTLESSGRFETLYVEADDEGDIRTAVEEIHALTGHRVHTLVCGGHGTRSSLAFGGEDLARGAPVAYDEADYVDPSDFYRGEFAFLDDYMEPDGQILLWSCSNGEGGAEAPINMANSASRAAPGRSVYSMREPGNILSLSVEADASLAVEWTNHAPYVAVSEDGAVPDLPPRGNTQNAA